MKVVFVAPYTQPMSIGGFEVQVYHIIEELTNLGIEAVWHRFENNEIADADILQVMATDPSMISMMKRAKNSGVKVVLTPMQGSRAKSNLYLKCSLRLSIIPQICTSHKLTQETISCADFLTPLCSFEAHRMHDVYGIANNRIAIIPNGIDKTFLDNKAIEVSLPFKNYMLIVGRVEENKNQLNVIKAARKLCKNLIIVGEPGSEGEKYMNRCKKESNDTIYFWGLEKNRLILKYLYQNASLTVISSYSEMVPLVAFESLSQNTPVICTNRCGINGDKIPGLFFSNITVNSLSRTILKALQFDTKHITNQGIYSWSDIAQKYIDVYKSLLFSSK